MGHLNNLSKIILLRKKHSFGEFLASKWGKKPLIWIGNTSRKRSLFDKTKNHCTPQWFNPFRWKHYNENTGKVSEELWVGLQWGESLLCTLSCLNWVERMGFIAHPFGWKHSGIAWRSQCACPKITGNVWLEPWVGLQWVKQSAPLGWVGN